MTIKELYEQCVECGAENLPLLVEIDKCYETEECMHSDFGVININDFGNQVCIFSKYKNPCVMINASQYSNKVYSNIDYAVLCNKEE